MASDRRVLVAESGAAGQRLDVFLARELPELSRSQIQRLIAEGRVHAGSHAAKSSLPVTAGLVVDVEIPAAVPATPIAESLPLSILFDDDDIVVIDKPAGMVVHPGAGHAGGTLVNALLHHVKGLSGIGGTTRPGIVHRLDRGTSGVMVVAKHDRAHRDLTRQFHDREVGKIYVALVWGAVTAGRRIDEPIGRDPRQRLKMSSRSPHARAALTTIRAVERLGPVSFIEVAIHTGRTHQIRVHLAGIGHAVAGDAVYGGIRGRLPPEASGLSRLARPFLHARTLTFTHPGNGRPLSFEAPLPKDLSDVLESFRTRTRTSAASGT
jgi:23S rRNA pseudouridine1911/1915/1917 synthase